jgi:nitroimidazol reductase NimA-like FMN-containing flavoprotein (pyridoxamine 5'-phosphate oxidase superfamily)
MSMAMSREQRESFLAELHVGVLSVAGVPGRAPLTVPIWYTYEPGGLVSFITGDGDRKTVLIREAGRVSLCVQSEEIPYRYVTVEGPVVEMQMPADPAERRALVHRYFGPELGDSYIELTRERASRAVTVRVRPEHWLSNDQSRLLE